MPAELYFCHVHFSGVRSLAQVVTKALGQRVTIDTPKVFLLREHQFYHGNAVVADRIVLFFYFKQADTGLAALIPGTRGAVEVARFRVTAGLVDPRTN